MPSIPRLSISVALTAAPSTVPKVTSVPANPAARAITRGSSALATSAVFPVAPWRISALASAIASTDAKNSRCTSATLVQTRTSGSAIATRRLISPA